MRLLLIRPHKPDKYLIKNVQDSQFITLHHYRSSWGIL